VREEKLGAPETMAGWLYNLNAIVVVANYYGRAREAGGGREKKQTEKGGADRDGGLPLGIRGFFLPLQRRLTIEGGCGERPDFFVGSSTTIYLGGERPRRAGEWAGAVIGWEGACAKEDVPIRIGAEGLTRQAGSFVTKKAEWTNRIIKRGHRCLIDSLSGRSEGSLGGLKQDGGEKGGLLSEKGK